MTPGRSRLREVILVVVTVQLIVWLLTACLLDGGMLCGRYSLTVLLYWLFVAATGMVWGTRGPAVRRVIAASGWVPPAGCLGWVCCGPRV